VRALKQLAADMECSCAQLALAWCLKFPYVSTAIIGATKPQQIDENLRALSVKDSLTPEIMRRLDALFSINLLGNPEPEE
jgi:aryl-alcohol dehydrogenase-like predicted oxidoreductase